MKAFLTRIPKVSISINLKIFYTPCIYLTSATCDKTILTGKFDYTPLRKNTSIGICKLTWQKNMNEQNVRLKCALIS